MPAKVRPEDTFNFDDWAADPRPEFEQVTLSNRKGYVTIVLKSATVDDDRAAEAMAKEYPDADDDERIIAACIVAAIGGKHEFDLDKFAPPFDPVWNPDQVHAARVAIGRMGWAELTMKFIGVNARKPEPEAPSSPES